MRKPKEPESGLVYSTDHGRMCTTCSQPILQCLCKTAPSAPTGDGQVRISRSTKGRKGKGVSIISGLALSPDELKQLEKELKQLCGTGGTVKNNCIEIQGDHRELLLKDLKRRGISAKLAGG